LLASDEIKFIEGKFHKGCFRHFTLRLVFLVRVIFIEKSKEEKRQSEDEGKKRDGCFCRILFSL
jgi:hypothetical protein